MGNAKIKNLSSYTIARNCCDLSDITAGIQELKSYFALCDKLGKKPANAAYIRFARLEIKKDKFNQ
jgi:hypothetical protein